MTGEATLVVPYKTSIKEGIYFLENSKEWLQKKIDKIKINITLETKY